MNEITFQGLKIRYSTKSFVLSHNREPSGKGLWAFTFRKMGGDWSLPWFPGKWALSYSEAKKLALREAKQRGAVEVMVEP
jgi:hypothetical protein